MEDWIIILLIVVGVIVSIITIVMIANYQKKSKIKKAQLAVLKKEEIERQRKQKVRDEINAKVNATLERRKQIQEQFKWLEGMNKIIESRSSTKK